MELKKALQLIQKAQEYSKPFNPEELFEICEKLISFQAWMIDPLLKAEQTYKQLILELEATEKLSNASARNKAETRQEYSDYKRIKYIYDLIGEQTKIVKKFATLLNDEQMNIP